jgi:hypothetical protein
LPLTFQKLSKGSLRSLGVLAFLNQNVEEVAVLVHRSPQVTAVSSDGHRDFIEKLAVAAWTLPFLDAPSKLRTEVRCPLAHCFIGYEDPAFGEQILDIAKTQAETVIQPHGVSDDIWRKAVSAVD